METEIPVHNLRFTCTVNLSVAMGWFQYYPRQWTSCRYSSFPFLLVISSDEGPFFTIKELHGGIGYPL